jgi:hypothetical protein
MARGSIINASAMLASDPSRSAANITDPAESRKRQVGLSWASYYG